MKNKVQKWGNSLAVRIPKVYADEMKLTPNSSVEMMVDEGALVITPAMEQRWALEELLSCVTEENIHHEWELGPPEGDELW